MEAGSRGVAAVPGTLIWPATGCGSGPAHLLRAELRDGIAAELTEYPVDFAGQNAQRALHARLAPRGQAVQRGAADHDGRRTERECLDDVGTAAEAAVDENGEAKAIDSADVNDYLREISGEDFSAKDFRTWAGTILAARFLREAAAAAEANTRGAKKQLLRAIARVAVELGNTPAVARKGYIHPSVIAAYLSGGLTPITEKDDPDPYRLSAEERSLLAVLGRAA